MASRAPSSAKASELSVRPGGPRPVSLSMSVQRAHPPREGGVISVLYRACHVFPPLVSLFGLFPVLVKCDY